MKQIYYLSNSENEHRFDAVFEDIDAMAIFYDIEKIPSLVAFVQRDKAISSQNAIIIDLQGADYSVAHILSAVQFLRKLTSADPIFIADKSDTTTQLFGNLSANFRVKNLIEESDETAEKLQAALEGRNSPLAFTENILAAAVRDTKSVVQSLEIPEGQVIDVGVAGTMERCGTTTQVLAIARLLNQMGFRSAVYDVDGSLSTLLAFCYGDELEEDEYGDVHLFGIAICQKWNEHYTAYVRDCGALTEDIASGWAGCDISVLVTPTKPWELTRAVTTLGLAQKSLPDRMLVMASFTEEQQAKELAPIFGDMMLSPWRPDVWSEDVPTSYRETFLPLLRSVCGDGC